MLKTIVQSTACITCIYRFLYIPISSLICKGLECCKHTFHLCSPNPSAGHCTGVRAGSPSFYTVSRCIWHPRLNRRKQNRNLAPTARWEPQDSILISETRHRAIMFAQRPLGELQSQNSSKKAVLKCIEVTEKWIKWISEHTFRQHCGMDFIHGNIFIIKENWLSNTITT